MFSVVLFDLSKGLLSVEICFSNKSSNNSINLDQSADHDSFQWWRAYFLLILVMTKEENNISPMKMRELLLPSITCC